MSRRFLSQEEIREALEAQAEVCYALPFGQVYKGQAIKQLPGPFSSIPDELGPMFVFEGDDVQREGVGGQFPVLAGELFLEG